LASDLINNDKSDKNFNENLKKNKTKKPNISKTLDDKVDKNL